MESHTFAVIPVLEDNEWDNWVTIEGYSAKQDERPDPHMQYCSPGFFQTLKIPVLLGRDFNDRDVAGAPKVGIVNQKFVKRYFGDAIPWAATSAWESIREPRRISRSWAWWATRSTKACAKRFPTSSTFPTNRQGLRTAAPSTCAPQGDPTQVFNTLRAAVREVDASVPMYDMRTLDDQMEISLLTERLLATLSSVFGCLATLLAALGLYGVMAFMVARRTREIGIRMALGAGQGSVVWMVLRETLTLAGIGVAIGLAGAYAVTRLIQAQLFGVQPTDLLTMAAASLGIAAVTALAGYIPARRATGIDPMSALRWE